MKKVVAVGLMACSSWAFAALGILIKSETATTPGGMAGWKCTYNVNGKQVVTYSKGICPTSANFD